YGLKPVGETYMQKITLVETTLDGHSTLRAGDMELQEGPDYALLRAAGRSVTAPLQKIAWAGVDKAQATKGAAVLIADEVPESAMRELYMAASRLADEGAAAVLVNSPALREMFEKRGGGRPASSLRMKDAPNEDKMNLIVLTPAAAKKAAQLAEGTPVALSVHGTERPRYTYNAIGVLPGSDPQAKPLLLTAHLDHLGVGRPVDGDAIYNGANDDASGTTVVLELARALAAGPRLRRTVYFVCFGSEERGQFGDRYFRDHPPVPLTSFAANLEFEMLAEQDPGLARGKMFLTGWERSNLGPALQQHGAHILPDPYPKQHYFQRSDNYTLAKAGVVAQTVGSANMEHYHQPSDDLAHADLGLLRDVIQSLIEPVRWLANSDFTPQWNPGGRP
ncbi:MAG TPA: M28 family peptidase, partial [Ramlibacter sp.]|nr:M28 family peptidase [Ramlibacter sp.]